jgi:hypothetical protein
VIAVASAFRRTVVPCLAVTSRGRQLTRVSLKSLALTAVPLTAWEGRFGVRSQPRTRHSAKRLPGVSLGQTGGKWGSDPEYDSTQGVDTIRIRGLTPIY